jgi:quercetin dioxygenase-like cupin family protein
MIILPMTEDGSADGVSVQHYMAGGVYAKQAILSAGRVLHGHKHTYDHLSILASGIVAVTVHGVTTRYAGPTGIFIAANEVHQITAITNALWYCVHAVPEYLQIDQVDKTLIAT